MGLTIILTAASFLKKGSVSVFDHGLLTGMAF